MRRWYALGLAAAVLTLFGASPMRDQFGARPALAAETWEVVVGTDVEAEGITLNSFLPSVLTVRAGDTVNWSFAGFHTVTFNAGRAGLPLIVPAPTAGELMLGAGAFPFPPGPTPPTGAYEGASQVSSGTPQGDPGEAPPFSLTFTRAGVYAYECIIHPGMEGTVSVVSEGGSLPETPAQARERGRAESDSLATAMRGQIGAAQAAPMAMSGRPAIHAVAAGLGNPAGVSALRFLAEDITVRRGDSVVWTNPDGFEIHTVSFTSGGPLPEFTEVRPGPAGPMGPPMIVIPANVAGPAGGGVYSGQGYANSGILGAGQSFAMRFDAPAGKYEYVCLVHAPLMKGTVTVTE